MRSYILNESAFASEVKISNKNPDVIEFITTLQEADAPNRNGRIYPKKVLEEALKSPYVQERLRTKSFIGEANHPLDTSVQRQMTIDLRNAAFIIKEVWWEGNLVKGRCETCNTAVGRDMKGLIEQGVQVAFSLRANGNVHTDPISGNTIVDSPLNIATYDWIVVPSHSKAFIERICEDTYFSMFRTNDRRDMVALCEAENIFTDGRMLEVEETQLSETFDYTKSFYQKYKKLSEMYFPEGNEEILSMNENEVVLKKDNTYKKVVLEDYLVKDIRSKIVELTETAGLRMGALGNNDGNNLVFKYTKASEEITDYELMQWLNENGYEPCKENVEILREEYLEEVSKGQFKKADDLIAQADVAQSDFLNAWPATWYSKFDNRERLAKRFNASGVARTSRIYLDSQQGYGKLAAKLKAQGKHIEAEEAIARGRSAKRDAQNYAQKAKEKIEQARILASPDEPEEPKKPSFLSRLFKKREKTNKGEDINESFSDFELMQWLDENGYEPTKENVEILREELERGE